MTSINRIGSQNLFSQNITEQVSKNEKVDIASKNLIPATQNTEFEKPKSSEFLDKALVLPPSAAKVKKELLTENNVNNFIQSKVRIEDQIGIAKDLKTWVKSNFRLHSVQERTVDSLTQIDLQTAETAAKRAAELNTKIKVKLGEAEDKKAESNNFENQNKLQMEQVNESVFLKFGGCEQQLTEQLQTKINREAMG